MSVISSLFGIKNSSPPPPPAIPEPPPPPTRQEASERAKDEAAKLIRGKGSESTIKTSGQGLLDPSGAPKKVLFGE